MPQYHEPLYPDTIYHLYTRAPGNEKIFISDENYQYFLSKFSRYIEPIADIYAWSLLPNHVNFLIRIKTAAVIGDHFRIMYPNPEIPASFDRFIMQRFSNLLNSYAKSFNKYYNRTGGLFVDCLRRIAVATEDECRAITYNIHMEPVECGLCREMDKQLTGKYQEPALDSHTVIGWFGGREAYTAYHAKIKH